MIDGPQIAIIDDKRGDVAYLIQHLDSLHIGHQYFDATPSKYVKPDRLLESIELVFLDLYYEDNFDGFDPIRCAQWIDEIVPVDKQYELVIWSKDTHMAQEVIEILKQINKSPRAWISRQKGDYPESEGIAKLMDEVKSALSPSLVEEYIGEILHVEEECVIIDCVINQSAKLYQKRRFEILPFKGYIDLYEGAIITIKVTTKPGSVLYEFLSNPDTGLKALFDKNDFFKDFDETAFLD